MAWPHLSNHLARIAAANPGGDESLCVEDEPGAADRLAEGTAATIHHAACQVRCGARGDDLPMCLFFRSRTLPHQLKPRAGGTEPGLNPCSLFAHHAPLNRVCTAAKTCPVQVKNWLPVPLTYPEHALMNSGEVSHYSSTIKCVFVLQVSCLTQPWPSLIHLLGLTSEENLFVEEDFGSRRKYRPPRLVENVVASLPPRAKLLG